LGRLTEFSKTTKVGPSFALLYDFNSLASISSLGSALVGEESRFATLLAFVVFDFSTTEINQDLASASQIRPRCNITRFSHQTSTGTAQVRLFSHAGS
jgi:hypothetical protein